MALVLERKERERIIVTHSESGDFFEIEINKIQKGYGKGMVWVAFLKDEKNRNFQIDRKEVIKKASNNVN